MAVLNDPTFELNQPSWVRRTLRASQPTRKAITVSTYSPPNDVAAADPKSDDVPVVEEVDQADTMMEDMITEFMSEVSAPKQQVLKES